MNCEQTNHTKQMGTRAVLSCELGVTQMRSQMCFVFLRRLKVLNSILEIKRQQKDYNFSVIMDVLISNVTLSFSQRLDLYLIHCHCLKMHKNNVYPAFS